MMPIQACATIQLKDAQPEIVRRTANFPPSIWGDRFLNYDSNDVILTHSRKQDQVEELKEVVRREVVETKAGGHLAHQLKLIDALQRLGVAYHFETEIEEALEHIHATFHDNDDANDLYNVALGFRLLRQHGYNVSCDIFNKFTNGNGCFKQSLIADVPGLLGLYEAAHLAIRGEEILDEAIVFTTTHLESETTRVSYRLAEQITQALERPLRKGLERVCARSYITIYQEETSHNEALLKLAKLDFNLVQALHKKELSEITRWWKELNFEKKLPFVRDRIVELYFWVVGVYFEPQYMEARKFLTKVIALVSVMDDLYDAYATFEELEILTPAIQRWDMKCIDELPDFMQTFYRTLLNVFDEIEDEMVKEGRSYRVYYAKESFKAVARAYFEEARWFHEGYIPTMEEYMTTAIVSGGYPMLSIISLVGMGDIVTEETFEWLFNDAKIVQASAILSRYMDDMVSNKFEKERGHVASSVDCYMKQYGVSEEETFDVFSKRVVELWKEINEEFIRPTAQPMPVLMRVLNLTKVVDFIYKEEDGYTRVGKVVKDAITSHFIDPLPVV